MKQKRTVYRVDIPKLKRYAARMAGNDIGLRGHPAAVMFLKEVMYAQLGMDKRELTPQECSNLITQGGFK